MGALTHNGEVIDKLPSEASQINYRNTTVENSLDNKANNDMIADDFDAAGNYSSGNYCVHEGKLYKFKNNHSGAWSASDVDEIQIAGELSAIKSDLAELSDAQASDIIAVAANYHDGSGRVYHFRFSHANNTNHNRKPIMIQTANQSGATKIIAALVKASSTDASVACSDSDVTYTWSDGVLDILVDCGNSAWATPYIYMPRTLYKSMV